ncbi:interferon-induced protein 44-like [Anabas testudineus]|uniref:Uncharacterized protein n=1 Tax=Anabas testudineus TaxID=64144 RepID=A0A3Q1H6A8_ANATE|nr:interferon-induced protein 44-like [Anabas testudineus]
MGRGSSKPAPLLDKSQRKISWRDKPSALQSVNNYRPQTEDRQLRILVCGPVGAGKSSFINSVQSVLRGRMCAEALVAPISEDCFTKKYTTYKIPKGKKGEAFYPFVLSDMMGLKERSRRNRKTHVKDVKRLLKGHVRDGYTFNPECKISKEDRFYNETPTINDKVHVLVLVIDANRQTLMRKEVVDMIQDIRDEASDLGIPQVVVFTKIDELCPEIKNDVKKVYRSRILQEKMQQFSGTVGFPMNCMFAVKNYTNTNLDNDTDTLILNTLKHVIDFGDDFLNRMVTDQEESSIVQEDASTVAEFHDVQTAQCDVQEPLP